MAHFQNLWKMGMGLQPQQFKFSSTYDKYMSHFSYLCKTEGENGISHLISEMA